MCRRDHVSAAPRSESVRAKIPASRIEAGLALRRSAKVSSLPLGWAAAASLVGAAISSLCRLS